VDAAVHVEAASGHNSDDDSDLRLILAPGSSLGSARAKVSALDLQGQLSIAKFPQSDDAYPVMQWEAVARILSLAIDEADDTAALDVAFGMALQFGLKQPAAKEIVLEVQTAVVQWRTCAATHGLSARDVARMASAFEHG
jgi:hypothetical protein